MLSSRSRDLYDLYEVVSALISSHILGRSREPSRSVIPLDNPLHLALQLSKRAMGVLRLLQGDGDIGVGSHARLVCVVTAAATSVVCVSKLLAATIQRRENAARRAGLNGERERMVAAMAQKTRQNKPFLTSKQAAAIQAMTFTEIANKLQTGDVTAVEALAVYQAQALQAHKTTNCLTACVMEASSEAEQLDNQGVPKGLLHGLPISIKDSIAMKDYVDSRGLTKLTNLVHSTDSVLVKVLKKQGAVPFVRTTVPQLLMSYETNSLIYGTSTNPHDGTRNCGGSSGGEGALIGGGGSLLGYGTDIGGSIRVPAAFSGICGLKPTVGRLSNAGLLSPKGQRLVAAAVGPMGVDVDSLVLGMKALLVDDMFELDPLIPPLPFNSAAYESKKPLTIGYYVDDGHYPACPSTARAVQETRRALEKAGHTLVAWTPPDVDVAIQALFRSFGGDGGRYFGDMVAGEEVADTMKPLIRLLCMSPLTRLIKYIFYKYVVGDARYATMVEACGGVRPHSIYHWWNFQADVASYREMFSASWRDYNLDAVICPSFTFPALKYGSSLEYYLGGSYVQLYNLVDYPAGVVPVTKVTDADISELERWDTGDRLAGYVRRDQQDAAGMPVGVQVVTSRWQEELCLRLMKEVETAAKSASG